MSIHICFIVSPGLTPLIREITSEPVYDCSYSVYTAAEPYQAYRLYKEHEAETDIYIFSGKMFLYTVSSRENAYRKPCFALDCISTNIKDILLSLLLENREIDFSRIFIDVSRSDYNFLGLKELLPVDQTPHFLDMDAPELDHVKDSIFNQETLESYMEYVHQKHIKLHKAGTVDLSITRFGTLPPHLDELGIPHCYIHPTRDYIRQFIRQVLTDYQQIHTLKDQIGAFTLRFNTPIDTASPHTHEALMHCKQIFTDYSDTYRITSNITLSDDTLEITMSGKDIHTLTDSLQDLRVVEEILRPLEDASIYTGLGFGRTIMEAKFNANTAAAVGRNSAGHLYCVTEDGKITGPLGDHPITVTGDPDPRIRALAERLEIDQSNLQKIITFTKISNTKVVTSEDISRYLQITRRSGNRILNKLVDHGGAVMFKDNMNGGKGRPRNCYELQFLDELE